MSCCSLWKCFVLLLAVVLMGRQPVAAADATTTGTLTIEPLATVGEYRIGGNLTVRMRILRPESNRDLDLAARVIGPGRQLLDAPQGSITVALVSPHTLVGEYASKTGTANLAVVEVTSEDGSTTPTLMRDGASGLAIDREGPLYFQLQGGQSFRSLIPDGFRIVAPLRQGRAIRLAISREQLDEAQIEGFRLSNLPVMLGREIELAALPDLP